MVGRFATRAAAFLAVTSAAALLKRLPAAQSFVAALTTPLSSRRVGGVTRWGGASAASPAAAAVEGDSAQLYNTVIEFLREHIQPSDQLLVMGAASDLPLRLSEDGYGTRDGRSFILILDSDEQALEKAKATASAMENCAKNMAAGKLRFELRSDMAGITDMEQSCVDAVLDNFCLDALTASGGDDAAGRCIDAAHTAVRLGNPMISLSRRPNTEFSVPFDARFGWVQELDGDPGAVSMWHRGKINAENEKNSLSDLGVYFYVYTNTDNC